jgi:hypothetical protein
VHRHGWSWVDPPRTGGELWMSHYGPHLSWLLKQRGMQLPSKEQQGMRGKAQPPESMCFGFDIFAMEPLLAPLHGGCCCNRLSCVDGRCTMHVRTDHTGHIQQS